MSDAPQSDEPQNRSFSKQFDYVPAAQLSPEPPSFGTQYRRTLSTVISTTLAVLTIAAVAALTFFAYIGADHVFFDGTTDSSVEAGTLFELPGGDQALPDDGNGYDECNPPQDNEDHVIPDYCFFGDEEDPGQQAPDDQSPQDCTQDDTCDYPYSDPQTPSDSAGKGGPVFVCSLRGSYDGTVTFYDGDNLTYFAIDPVVVPEATRVMLYHWYDVSYDTIDASLRAVVVNDIEPSDIVTTDEDIASCN